MPANRLINETSPYLLGHAHNPVDWYPWGEEALLRARNENKPVLVSIGYSACHWCHVMERESFEDIQTAELMNSRFVCIKVDREERPDLDHIYMDAVQAMTGSGGWPLNVFLTPDGKPFFGGTYYPPRPAFNRPSWVQLLTSIAEAYQAKRQEIEDQGESLTSYIVRANDFGLENRRDPGEEGFNPFRKEILGTIVAQIMKTADKRKGGFGSAPKFPQTFLIQYLLHHYHFTGDESSLNQACLSLDRMIQGGIYDQLGGGFARYATDDNWLIPHFEKMLYDNALLVTVISEAYQLTHKEEYKRVVEETMDFVSRELLSPDGGFYAALDADSEGEEGKYYLWDKSELERLLKEEAALFCSYFNVTAEGNWEGRNILYRPMALKEFAESQNRELKEVEEKLARCRATLLEHRNRRVHPALDDKILLGWNALMIAACCKAYAALGKEAYRDLAVRNLEFLWNHFRGEGIYYFYHTYKDKRASHPGFLDDYAFLVYALIQLQEVTGNSEYLTRAKEITEWVIVQFGEEETGYFFFTHRDQRDVIVRKKEMFDGAVASGNAVMSFNILLLGEIFDVPAWKSRAESNCRMLARSVIQYPLSFGFWATMVQVITYGLMEIVMTGENLHEVRKVFLHNFIPNRVFQSATGQNSQFPLLKDKPLTESTLIFLCKDYSCQNPVNEVHELVALIGNVYN
jgi:uncharacterized protein YyaL (SSP411 family)